MTKRLDRFMVGYLGAGNTVYGKPVRDKRVNDYVDPMRIASAKRRLREMPCSGAAIFELLPVQFNKKRR